MILYLHGFRSSPQSFKARLLRERLEALGRSDDYLCPQLPASPQAAFAHAKNLVANSLGNAVAKAEPSQLTIIGSSLGGYYATKLAEELGCRAVLLNPAITPAQHLASQIGITTAWHSDESFEFRSEYIQQLAELAVPVITRPERYFLIAATGDEVLDWQEMTAHYAGARQHLIQGSDHGLSDFEQYMDDVLEFCGI